MLLKYPNSEAGADDCQIYLDYPKPIDRSLPDEIPGDDGHDGWHPGQVRVLQLDPEGLVVLGLVGAVKAEHPVVAIYDPIDLA